MYIYISIYSVYIYIYSVYIYIVYLYIYTYILNPVDLGLSYATYAGIFGMTRF